MSHANVKEKEISSPYSFCVLLAGLIIKLTQNTLIREKKLIHSYGGLTEMKPGKGQSRQLLYFYMKKQYI